MTDTLYKNVNGEQVELTEEEVAQYYADQPSEEELLEDLRDTKMADLNSYYDSKEVKETTVSIQGNDYQVINDQKLRSLLADKIDILERKLSQNLITDEEAIFSFKINEEANADLNIEEIQELLFFLDADRQSKFIECQNHEGNIKGLNSETEIDEYIFS